MNALIFEDNSIQRTILRDLLEQKCNISIAGEFSNPLVYMNSKLTQEPDVIFLDIEMPGMTGIEFLDSTPLNCPVIITSSKKEYAFDAFQFNVVAYLLKPFSLSELKKAISEIPLDKKKEDSLHITSGANILKLYYNDILFIKGAVNYVEIHTAQKMHLIYTSLNAIENKLPQNIFMRVHRSTIVNLNYVRNFNKNTTTIHGHEIKVSLSYKAALLEKMK